MFFNCKLIHTSCLREREGGRGRGEGGEREGEREREGGEGGEREGEREGEGERGEGKIGCCSLATLFYLLFWLSHVCHEAR